MLGEKWDQSEPKGHNKFPIWQHYPWTRAWDNDNHLFNSNKQSSVFLRLQAVFQQTAFCSDLIQVVSTAAGLRLSKKTTTTCKQDDSKAGFLVNPRIPSKQTRKKSKATLLRLSWRRSLCWAYQTHAEQDVQRKVRRDGVTKSFGGRMNLLKGLSITVKPVIVVKRVDFFGAIVRILLSGRSSCLCLADAQCAASLFSLCSVWCQLFLLDYLSIKDPNFHPFSSSFHILFILPKSHNFPLYREMMQTAINKGDDEFYLKQ